MSRTKLRGAMPIALLASFAAGVLVDGWLRTHGPPKPAIEKIGARPDAAPPPVESGFRPTMGSPDATVGTSGDVPHRKLRLPLDGVTVDSMKGGFAERRDAGGRPHEAVDMPAPRNTPVHAVDDGTIAKLFTSKAGGLTIYQYDPAGRLCYYYAHLERYADGLKDGQQVSQGDVIGYVGTSGNAPPDTPHLHFAVFELNADKRWWEGKPLDPYALFKSRG